MKCTFCGDEIKGEPHWKDGKPYCPIYYPPNDEK